MLESQRRVFIINMDNYPSIISEVSWTAIIITKAENMIDTTIKVKLRGYYDD